MMIGPLSRLTIVTTASDVYIKFVFMQIITLRPRFIG